MLDLIVNPKKSLVGFMLTLCLPSIAYSAEQNDQPVLINVIGTWQYPGPDEPPEDAGWGPMRVTFVLYRSGNLDAILTSEMGGKQSVPESVQISGTYKITYTTFETNIENNIQRSMYMLRKDRLILIDEGKSMELKRIEWRVIPPAYHFVNEQKSITK